MALDLTPLAVQASSGPTCDVTVHVWPNESLVDQFFHSPSVWMRRIVNIVEYLSPQPKRNVRPHNMISHITEKRRVRILDSAPSEPQRRRSGLQQGPKLYIAVLLLGYIFRRNYNWHGDGVDSRHRISDYVCLSRCCLGEGLSDCCIKAKDKGRWSVITVRSRPSMRCLKNLIPLKITRSSRSYAL